MYVKVAQYTCHNAVAPPISESLVVLLNPFHPTLPPAVNRAGPGLACGLTFAIIITGYYIKLMKADECIRFGGLSVAGDSWVGGGCVCVEYG